MPATSRLPNKFNILLAEYQKLDPRIVLFETLLFNLYFGISTRLHDVDFMSTLMSNYFFCYTNVNV